MTPPTFRPSTIYIEIDVSSLSLIDAERYFNDLRGVGFPMPRGCRARGRMEFEEVDDQ
jgi:hypothetical protein